MTDYDRVYYDDKQVHRFLWKCLKKQHRKEMNLNTPCEHEAVQD